MIISRYLIKEVSYTFFAVTFVLLLIFLSNQFIRYLKYAAKGKIAASILLQLVGFEIPYLLALILPLAIYLGVIFTYGRLYTDNELRVMQAYGLSTKKLLMITGTLGLSVTLLVGVLMVWVNPYLANEKNKLITKNMATDNILDTLIPGRFQVAADDHRVLYVESVSRNHKEAKNIFIAEMKKTDEKANWTILSAEKGAQERDPKTKERFVVAKTGYRYEGTPGQNAYKIIHFEKYGVRIMDQALGIEHQPYEVVPTKKLMLNYQADTKNAAELQWRLSMPLATLLLTLLAIPLSYARPRQSRYVYLFPALLIYVVYLNLLFITRDWISNKVLSPVIGMWWVHGLLLVCIAVLIMIQFRQFPSFALFKKRPVRKLA